MSNEPTAKERAILRALEPRDRLLPKVNLKLLKEAGVVRIKEEPTATYTLSRRYDLSPKRKSREKGKYKNVPQSITRQKVLDYLKRHPRRSRREAAIVLNISWNVILNAFTWLRDRGLIVEADRRAYKGAATYVVVEKEKE